MNKLLILISCISIVLLALVVAKPSQMDFEKEIALLKQSIFNLTNKPVRILNVDSNYIPVVNESGNLANSNCHLSGDYLYCSNLMIGNIYVTNIQANRISQTDALTGNYTNGNCWIYYKGGIAISTNCTKSK